MNGGIPVFTSTGETSLRDDYTQISTGHPLQGSTWQLIENASS
jgi:hypothetical protein